MPLTLLASGACTSLALLIASSEQPRPLSQYCTCALPHEALSPLALAE
jgi:hypothetical protein